LQNENPPQGPVIWCAESGLANRLRALCGFRALAELEQRAFYLVWETGPTCEADFSELFEAPKLAQIRRSEIDARVSSERATVYTDSEWYDRIWERHAKDTHSWEAFRGAAYSMVKQLEPVPSIAGEVRAFAEEHALEDATGLHVRWTDNLQEYDVWEKHAPSFRREHVSRIEGFVRFLRESPPGPPPRRVFLATDNPSVESALAKSFDGELITFPKTYSREYAWKFSLRRLRPFKQLRRTTSMREALIDLLLLSRCRVIAGTYFSSFGELASLLGTHELYTIKGDGYEKGSFVHDLAGAPPGETAASPET